MPATKEGCESAGGVWLPLSSHCDFSPEAMCEVRGGNLINNRSRCWWCDVDQKFGCERTGGTWYNTSFYNDVLGWREYDHEVTGFCYVVHLGSTLRFRDFRQGKCEAHNGQWEPLS